MEGGMVGVQCEWAALEVDSPSLKSMDDGKEFLFICGVIIFSWVHFPRCECNRLESVALILLENCTNSKARCISGDDKGECRVWDAENWSASEGGLEGVKGSLGLSGPGVWGI